MLRQFFLSFCHFCHFFFWERSALLCPVLGHVTSVGFIFLSLASHAHRSTLSCISSGKDAKMEDVKAAWRWLAYLELALRSFIFAVFLCPVFLSLEERNEIQTDEYVEIEK
jgi:hypothetical protein